MVEFVSALSASYAPSRDRRRLRASWIYLFSLVWIVGWSPSRAQSPVEAVPTAPAYAPTKVSAPSQTATAPTDAAISTPVAPPASALPKAIIRRGTGAMATVPVPAAPATTANPEGFQLNFADTDIATVVGTVLGDGLGMPYVVSPQVKGTLTLQATRALGREETLAALEAALRVQGAAMVDVNGVMHVVPLKDAPREITGLRIPGQGAPGFGIYVVALQYVSAAEMEKLLTPFAPEGGIVRVDNVRNLLLLAGTGQEVSTLLGVVNTFDVDWLAGMSFAMYPLSYVDPKTLAEELGQIFTDAKSPIAGVVRLVPLSRLNTLLVVTPQAKYLTEVESWIKQLDVAGTAPGRRIYVYDVQNGKADDLAKSLASILSLSIDSSLMNSSSSSGSGSASRFGSMQSGVGGGGLQGQPLQSSQYPQSSSYPQQSQAMPQMGMGMGMGLGGLGSSQPTGPVGLESPNIKIVPNSENNSLLILASPSEYTVIEAALKRLDIVPIEVLIEASIAEVTLTDGMQFGINWSLNTKYGPAGFVDGSGNTVGQSFPGLSLLYNSRTNIQAVLNSLESLTSVKVISSPKLLVLNNREADLEVGDEVPIITQSAVSTETTGAPVVNTVQMQSTGVILHVTPRANKSGRIMLDISQEVSDVTATTSSSINSPTIEERKISSTVSVDSGNTIALGGLIQDSRSSAGDGIPFLRRIPLLGPLFGSVNNTKQRTELIVLITPRIIRSGDESDEIMHELRSEFEGLKKMAPEKPLQTSHVAEGMHADAVIN